MSDIVERLRDPSLGSPRWATTMEEAANEIVWLRKERDRLAAELGKAHRDIIPWIEKAGAVAATQEAGKVTVSRELVESVLEDARLLIDAEYVVNGQVHPALQGRYLRDMDDIWKLKAEIGGTKDE